MNLVSIRLITADVSRLAGFYEKATGLTVTWFTDDFAELGTARGTLAIGSARTAPTITPAANRSAIIEFLVDDVDALDLPGEPVTMPWGNRSLLVEDPDGNVVNFFTPVTDAAKAKFGVS
jgi:catechol 2,3-dioxygenase-like lactoylglutathione lyase family enzyme